MKRRFSLTLFFIVLTNCLFSSHASSRHLTKEWVQQAATSLVEDRIADGLSIGYIEGKNYGVVHAGNSGQAGQKKANNKTIYEIGSVSKIFTSLLLADAVVRGDLDLEEAAKVANPAKVRFPSHGARPITWLDLSTHRSGLPRLPTNMTLTDLKDPYKDYDAKKAAAFLSKYELPRAPGESQEYSNFAVSVLGYLVSQKSDMSYEQLLRERIADPLKMVDCTVSLNSDQKKRFAKPHDKFGSPASPWTFANLPGAGGIRATMQDMMRFARAHLSPPEKGTIGEAIELTWKKHTDADGSGSAMGLGWMIAGDGQTRWHNGQTGGYHSAVFINRRLNCAVVILCNTAVNHEIDKLAMNMVKIAAGQEIDAEPAFAKKSPFAAVRWEESRPEVKVDGEWYKLVSLDGIPTVAILSFCRETFKDRWQKRFQEDLVEVLSRMDHPPGDTVKLVVQSLASLEKKTLEDVPMTEENRRSIWRAAQQTTKPSNDDSELRIDATHRARLEGRYKLTPNFIFTVRDKDGHLMVSITNQPTQEVFPDSLTRWSYRGVDATLEFKLSKTGSAKSLILHQNGIKQTARRMR